MYSVICDYAIEKSFNTEQEAEDYVHKQFDGHYMNSKYVVVEVKKVLRAKVPVEVESVPLEEFKKDCNCISQGIGVQTLLSN